MNIMYKSLKIFFTCIILFSSTALAQSFRESDSDVDADTMQIGCCVCSVRVSGTAVCDAETTTCRDRAGRLTYVPCAIKASAPESTWYNIDSAHQRCKDWCEANPSPWTDETVESVTQCLEDADALCDGADFIDGPNTEINGFCNLQDDSCHGVG